MLLSAVSVLVDAQSSSEIPEVLMNNPVYLYFSYGPYGLYRASVPVQGRSLPLPLLQFKISLPLSLNYNI